MTENVGAVAQRARAVSGRRTSVSSIEPDTDREERPAAAQHSHGTSQQLQQILQRTQFAEQAACNFYAASEIAQHINLLPRHPSIAMMKNAGRMQHLIAHKHLINIYHYIILS